MFFIKKISDHRLFALLSFLCPIFAALLSWVVTKSHEQFWMDVLRDTTDDAYRHAGVLMGVSEGFQILILLAFGFILGLLFAIISVVLRRTILGFFALALNFAPYLWIVLMKR